MKYQPRPWNSASVAQMTSELLDLFDLYLFATYLKSPDCFDWLHADIDTQESRRFADCIVRGR